MKAQNYKQKHNEGGAILFIALAILLIVTLMGLSAITLTSTQQQVTTNIQAENQVFHAAEAAINEAIGNDDALFEAVSSSPEIIAVDLQNSNITSTATINLTGSGTVTGFSLGVEGGAFAAYQFEITGTGEIPDLNSKAESVQGLYKIAPGS